MKTRPALAERKLSRPPNHPRRAVPSQTTQPPPSSQAPRDSVVAALVDFQAAKARRESQRHFAQRAGVPRSTLQDWLARKARSAHDPREAEFFESPAGLQFLHRLQVAAHLALTLRGACGLHPLAFFFQLAGLSRWLGASYGSQRKVAKQVEATVVAYGKEERTRLAKLMSPKALAVCEDETYHPEPCLVAIEPVSNFILLEQYAKGRDAKTWDDAMTKALQGLPVTIEQVTSDEAKGLRKHVKEGLGAQANSDLFHVQYEVSRGSAVVLAAQVRRAEEDYDAAKQKTREVCSEKEAYEATAHGPGRPPDFVAKLSRVHEVEGEAQAALDLATERKLAMQAANRALSAAYHPFELESGAPRTAEQVSADLSARFAEIHAIAKEAALPERCQTRLRKAARLVPSLVATIAFVHHRLAALLATLEPQAALGALLTSQVIPALYLLRVAAKGGSAVARAKVREVAERLLFEAKATATYRALSGEAKEQAWRVATQAAELFQRSSSCVEGRNGQLALRHHHQHRLSGTKLEALTVVHNYVLKRRDGTTAAERFFEAAPGELFERLCKEVALPVRPRVRTRRSGPSPLLAVG